MQNEIRQLCRDYLEAKKYDNKSAKDFAGKLKNLLDADLVAFAEEWGLDVWEAKEWLRLTDSIPALRLRIEKGRAFIADMEDQPNYVRTESEAARSLLWQLRCDLAIDEDMWAHLNKKMADFREAF